jgi:hypothetical protein
MDRADFAGVAGCQDRTEDMSVDDMHAISNRI